MVLVVLSGLGSRRTHQGELHSSVRSWSSSRFGSDARCSRTHAWRFSTSPTQFTAFYDKSLKLTCLLLQSSLTWRALSRPHSMQVPMLASRPGCSGVQGFFCSHGHGCRVGWRWLAGSARCRRLRSGAVHRAPCACERAQLDAVDCGAMSARSAVRWRAGSA